MIEALTDLNQIRIIAAIAMLGYASYTDVAKREISDYVWIVFGVLAAVMLIFEPQLPDALSSIGISLIIAPIANVDILGMLSRSNNFLRVTFALSGSRVFSTSNERLNLCNILLSLVNPFGYICGL